MGHDAVNTASASVEAGGKMSLSMIESLRSRQLHPVSRLAIRFGIFAVLLSLFLGSPKAEAADRFLRVPVFFITDRNLQPRKNGEVDFGPFRKYIGECKHDPYMGPAYCVVENVEGKELTDKLQD